MHHKKLTFGIIGCGRIAQRHAEEIKKAGELICVCDTDKEKGKLFADKFGVIFYADYNEMLRSEKSADVISVCTPNGLHAEHSIMALDAGFHVLCEKPMAIHTEDCKLMMEAAERNSRQLIIVKQNRFNPAVVAVKKAILEGHLGSIYSFQLSCFWNRGEAYYKNSWHGNLKMDGGTLFTQFSHFIDIMYWYFGDAEKVSGFFSNTAHKNMIEFEDTGTVALQLVNGITGTLNYTVNSYEENMEGSLTIFGEKGTVKIGGQYLNIIRYQHIKDYSILYDTKQTEANNYGFYRGSMSNHHKVYENLIDVIINGASIAANANDGLKTVEIIEKIYQDRNKFL